MKKLFSIALLFISVFASAQTIKQKQVDGLGDSLRKKVDTSNVIRVDTTGSVDGDEAYLDKSNLIVKFRTPTGGNSADSIRFLNFTAGDTDAPDSILLHTAFVNKKVRVFREGEYQHSGTIYGIEFDKDLGKIIFHPALTDGERISIEVRDTINARTLALEPPASSGFDNTEIDDWAAANGISDNTILTAYDNFVSGLKSASLWTKILGIYHLGNNFNESKYNLVNPAQLLTQTGSGTFSSGYVRNAGTDYLETIHTGADNSGDITVGVAVKEDNSGGSIEVAIGILEGTNQTYIIPKWTTVSGYLAKAGNVQLTGSNSNSTGRWFLTQKVSSTSEVSLYKNATQLGTTSSTPTAATGNWLIGNGGSSANNAMSSRLRLAIFSKYLTSSEVATVDGLLSTLLTAIN